MKILMTGSDGYLGSVIAPELLRAGYDVTGVDTGFFRTGRLYRADGPEPVTLTRDVRHLTVDDLRGFEAVVHLGELSNDPLSDLLGSVTPRINYAGSVFLASLARQAGVSRFVYMSSCSVYGDAGDELVTEESPPRPQTIYASCKQRVETDVSLLADDGPDGFSPTFLRNATAYGASPRMRFDIVLNNIAGLAYTTGTITLSSDGTPWRPLVHAIDIGTAIRCVLDAPRDVIHNKVFNVGSDEQNYQIGDIADIVGEVFGSTAIHRGSLGGDRRSYRVSFAKIHQTLPRFRCVWDARSGAAQLAEIFAAVGLEHTALTDRRFIRLHQLKHLLDTGELDENLFWRRPTCAS